MVGTWNAGTMAYLPTNKKMTSPVRGPLPFEGGKIVPRHTYFDQVEAPAQRGLMPLPSTS